MIPDVKLHLTADRMGGRSGDGGGSEENCARKYGCHARARAVEKRGVEGGRKEGWRVEMMDVLLSFCAP